jgi:hypothetical protein
MNIELNDSLDDLIFRADGPVRASPVAAPSTYVQPTYTEVCGKCRGTGQYSHFGQCFACKGKGKFLFKTSPEVRAKNRQRAADRADRRQQDAWTAFAAQHQAVAEWIIANRARFDFAAKLNEAVIRFGDLTTGQREAVERCIARDVAKATERAERAQQAPQADTAGIDRLKVSFDRARAYAAEKGLTMRTPKITIGGVTISPAKADGKNPGALYVKAGSTYLGKVQNGRLFAARECTPDQEKQVLAFIADPAEAAKVYGQTTGVCCVCNATLRSKWKLAGIGPVCAEKMGWAPLARDFGGVPE